MVGGVDGFEGRFGWRRKGGGGEFPGILRILMVRDGGGAGRALGEAALEATGSGAYQEFRDLLDELFQFQRADLDFGIYRILNLKRAEISRFLDERLLPQVREALGVVVDVETGQKEAELEQLRLDLDRMGVDYAVSTRYRELAEDLAGTPALDALERTVFSDLYTFFGRYYDDGDFISQRRYKAGVYAIPYEGEEVKLHWANADQYYVKTTENFQDYRFRLPDGRYAQFRIVAAGTERDNNRAEEGKERRFVLRADEQVGEAGGELQIRFEYRAEPGRAERQDRLNAASSTRPRSGRRSRRRTTMTWRRNTRGTSWSITPTATSTPMATARTTRS